MPVPMFPPARTGRPGRLPAAALALAALLALAGVKPDAAALAELQERQPSEDPAKIDEEWAEAPVTFLASAAHDMGGPTGVVAKIRASNRAASREAGNREPGA